MWSQSFQITSLLVNPLGKLGLFGTLNLLQETAWGHAEKFGFGMNAMESAGYYWVVTRQTLQMTEWPRHGEKVSIVTWIRPPEGAFITREFLIQAEDGRQLGACATSWLALDRESKKILPIADIRPWKELSSENSTGIVAKKVAADGVFESVAKYRVRVSDLDFNQHVNNTKYSQWILDSIPYELHKVLFLSAYSVNFISETHLGDEVRVERKASTRLSQEASTGQTIYRGIRVADDRVLFTAALSWEKKA